jgi:hypothetical protein
MNTLIFDAVVVKLLSCSGDSARRGRMPNKRGRAPKGRRERNGEDKLHPIKQVACRLFAANGYDEA